MKREIVVFERDERFTSSGKPELDFRLIRQALPAGSCPLVIASEDGFMPRCGQWFSEEEVVEFCRIQSGYNNA